MKKPSFLFILSIICSLSILQSCTRTSDDVWDDTKSAGRHLQRGAKAIVGCHDNSRQVRCRSDFEGIEDQCANYDSCYQDFDYQNQFQPQFMQPEEPIDQSYDFVPLQDPANNDLAMGDYLARQPRETPGEPGSSIPSIQSFQDPSTIPELAGIFKPITFEYDSSLVKGPANLQTLHQIAYYLRSHAYVYVFIEGHTDERGPQAYNLALGARRANTVRNMLISEGINPDNLFTISYGKERPVMMESHEESHAQNRRVEFKVYAR
jgi:peptidoglycan-associated lipoprotein